MVDGGLLSRRYEYLSTDATRTRLTNLSLDSNLEVRTTLVEEYSNEENPSDGEIFRNGR